MKSKEEGATLSTYVISDLHGNLEAYHRMLKKINFQKDDVLYILGDVLDRGPNPIKLLLEIMAMPNVTCLLGNHELMALDCLEFLVQEITDMSIEAIDEKILNNLLTWQYNGSKSTIDEFRKLNREMQQAVIEFIKEFPIYEEITVAGKDYLLVHAGGGYHPGKDIEEYTLKELVWDRAEYSIQYYPDVYLVTGHTPTQEIKDNPRPGYIYQANNHIAIDCGCCFPKGRLGCLRLDDMKEFYVETEEVNE